MEQLPVYIQIVFILTALLTLFLLYKGTKYSKVALVIVVMWLTLQTVVSLSGFYTVTTGTPPRFALLLIPPVVFIIVLFILKKSRQAITGFDAKTLTLLHIVRIPVELTLYWLFLYKVVPQVMTFEGRNFDIFCGLTAPFIYYFGYVKNSIGRNTIIIWNLLCLVLLANIVITAILSAPFSFQKFGYGHPNIALFYFPYIWLPCFIVPAALFAHLVSLRQLFKGTK